MNCEDWHFDLQLPTVHEEEAPSGMLARGKYDAISSFVDDDKKKHLEFEWKFEIVKDWPEAK